MPSRNGKWITTSTATAKEKNDMQQKYSFVNPP